MTRMRICSNSAGTHSAKRIGNLIGRIMFEILHGDVREVLASMGEKSVQM